MADKNLKRGWSSDVEEEEEDIGVFSQAAPVVKNAPVANKSGKKLGSKVIRVKKKRKVYVAGK